MKNYAIQKLRAIATIAVLLGHMPIFLPSVFLHGYSFVTLFLVISGFFAGKQFCVKYDDKLNTSYVLHCELLNRVFRLIPLMLIWILIYFLIGNITSAYGFSYGDIGRWQGELKSAFLLYYNYYLANSSLGGLFGQYWTLYVEIHFYLLFLMLFLMVKSNKDRCIYCYYHYCLFCV